MKRLALLLFAALSVFAISTVEDMTPFDVVYDHTGLYPTRIYANGILLKEYSTNEVRLVSNNGTNNTYGVTVPIFTARSTVEFTATVFYLNGTNVVESEPSNILPIQFRPRKPGNFRRFQ